MDILFFLLRYHCFIEISMFYGDIIVWRYCFMEISLFYEDIFF